MQQRTVIRYSMGFKQQVIRQLESGRFDSISHPEQNGCHERMHKTLKDHTVIPPAKH